ncbi:MAG: hypothetical protein AAGD09_19335 [Cyanobacteria bacterium P01_F01_bin.56]
MPLIEERKAQECAMVGIFQAAEGHKRVCDRALDFLVTDGLSTGYRRQVRAL